MHPDPKSQAPGPNITTERDLVPSRRYRLAWVLGSATVIAGLGTIGTAVGSTPGLSPAATQGQSDFQQNCASCHGANLEGGFGPGLTGADFKARWAAKAPDALEKYIAEQMPPSDPGGLSKDTYEHLAAFIKAKNGLSSGAGGGQPTPSAGKAATAASPAAATSTPAKSGVVEGDQVATESGGAGFAEVNKDSVYEAAMKRRSDRLAAIKPVSEAMLVDPPAADWLSYRRDSLSSGFSPLHQIGAGNVGRLTLGWAKALPAGTNGITPLVHDGVLFVDSMGTVLALDGATGDQLWKFERPAQAPTMGPPVTQPRGMAIYQDRLIVPTSDNHVIALDMHSGAVVWDHAIEGMRESLRITAAPLVVGDRVVQGMSGCAGMGEPGGCFLVGLDAKTGKEAWRFHTIPKKGDPNGDSWNNAPDDQRTGASIWDTPSYDPETGLIYVGTSQTYHIAPLIEAAGGVNKSNAALYTDSTIALDPETGKLKWFYQHMDRDVWDLDWVFERTIATIPVKGHPRRVVMTVGKIGMLDMLDAKTGKYVGSYDLGYQTLVTKVDPVTGRKTTDPALEPDATKEKFLCPFAAGVRNWPGTSFDQASSTLFVPLTKNCMTYSWKKGQGWDISYAVRMRPNSDGSLGGLAAVDLATLKPRWEAKFRAPTASAVLGTAGGIVFAGGRDRIFRALDSRSGSVLWEGRLDNIPSASPISYQADGQQFVAITTGGGNPNDATVRTLTPELEGAVKGTTLWVFQLAKQP